MATSDRTSRMGHRCTGATRALRALRGRARTEQSGFTIVETVVAITIAAMVFTATALMLGGALKGTLLARQNEQAAEVLTAEIEAVRSQDYAAIAMVAADLAGDPAIIAGAFDHDGAAGPLAAQPLFVAPTGTINPHLRTVTVNSTPYTVGRYVSEEVDAATGARVKRVTAVARWQSGAGERERSSSTLITRVRRGLPLPDFTWGPEKEITVAAGAGGVSFPVTLTNRGARDRWNLTVASPGLAGTWTWYHDLDGDKVLSAGDVALTNTDADLGNLVDTGWVQVDEARDLVVVYDGTVPDPSDLSYPVSLTATSSAQPDVPPGTSTIVDTVKRPAAVLEGCPTCTVVDAYLLNSAPPCDTAATSCATTAGDPLPLDGAPPVAADLADYDTNLDTAAVELRGGRRVLGGGGVLDEANKAKVVRWSRQMGVATKVSTRAIVHVYAAPLVSGADGTVKLTAVVVRRPQGGGSDVVLGTASTTLTGTDPSVFELKKLDVPLPASTAFGKNDRIEVRIVVEDPMGTDAVRVAYDTTAYRSMVSYGVTT